MEQVRAELKRTGTISLNDTDVRKLAGKTSGTISMNDLRGKKASESVTDYVLYSGSHTGKNEDFSFSFNLPHNVISGTITSFVSNSGSLDATSGNSLSVQGLNIGNGGYYYETYITNASGMTKRTFTGNGNTGERYQSSGSNSRKEKSTMSISIKFTGEWEL